MPFVAEPRSDALPADAGRAPFTRDDLMANLSQVLWAVAHHIAVAGPDVRVANAFLGVAAFDPKDETLRHDAPDFRLERFPITAILDRAYDFAFQVGPRAHRHAMADSDVWRMRAFQEGSPRGLGADMTTPMADGDSVINRTMDAAYARWSSGGPMTVRELALLANMSEPAVRNALSKEGIKLRSNVKGDKNGVVDAEEAARWLAGRRGFVPTLEPEPTDPFYIDDFRRLLVAEGFEGAASSRLSGWPLADVAREARVDPEWLLDVVMGRTALIDLEALIRVAHWMWIDAPAFVGHCVEKSLRAQQVPRISREEPVPPELAALVAELTPETFETDPRMDEEE